MQTEDFVTGADVFTSEYAYFSSMSDSWLRHAQEFVSASAERLALGSDSFVVEVASNDGYLLRYVRELGIPCLGIEPTASTAEAAESLGLIVERRFLTATSAGEIVSRYGQADLVVANNVIAHVPDIVDFARGLATLTKKRGTISIEFAYGVALIREGQFDTVYHEHFSYLTLTSLSAVLEQADLVVVDVEPLPTHGGSLRVFAQHRYQGVVASRAAHDMIEMEDVLGVSGTHFYSHLQSVAEMAKHGLLRFLLDANESGAAIAGYGAAAKGNTLLNFAGVRSDLLPYVVDKSPGKVGRFLPGSRIPVLPVSALTDNGATGVLLLPWNLRQEVQLQLSTSLENQPAIYVAVPTLERIN